MARNIHQEVTARILAELEAGAAPWVKEWSAFATGDAVPQNAVTRRPYSGCNVVLLWMARDMAEWPTGRFLTFKQALDAGGHVRKGEKGSKVYFVSTIEREEDGKLERIPFLKEYTVFNVAQCDNLPDSVTGPRAIKPRNHDRRDPEAEAFIAATGAIVRHGEGRAFYRPTTDTVHMPDFEAFRAACHYYATIFHELAHWTGAEKRLDRKVANKFGSERYAFEELVAELTAAFLCAEWSFDGELRHAGYIGHWQKLLKDHDRAFFAAASAAQKAADYLRGLAIAETMPIAA